MRGGLPLPIANCQLPIGGEGRVNWLIGLIGNWGCCRMGAAATLAESACGRSSAGRRCHGDATKGFSFGAVSGKIGGVRHYRLKGGVAAGNVLYCGRSRFFFGNRSSGLASKEVTGGTATGNGCPALRPDDFGFGGAGWRSGECDGARAAGLAPGAGPRSAMPLPIDDERTLAELRRGHWAAMEELVHRYQDRLFATVLRLVGHPEDAADLVQETFVRAMQNVARFEGKSSLYTWLFRIAVNLSLSHRRSRSYRDAVSLDGPAESGGGEAVNRQAAGLKRQLAAGDRVRPGDAGGGAVGARADHRGPGEAGAGFPGDHRAAGH